MILGSLALVEGFYARQIYDLVDILPSDTTLYLDPGQNSMKAPVVLVIFRRPDSTRRVMSSIRQARPTKLLIIADGPRPDRVDEAKKCAAARAIVEQVDWDCEVLTNYSDVNMGCKKRLSTGLDWVFENVEEAIILEDDCLPHASFFNFCEELLNYYRDDQRVMHIAGNNFSLPGSILQESYYFSRLTYIWGWATWRRAWQYYDVDIKAFPQLAAQPGFIELLGSKSESQARISTWSKVYKGMIDTWDYQWQLACLSQGAFTVVPNKNLVSNIGFNADSTHTANPNSPMSNLKTEAMGFPLVHPSFVIRDVKADAKYLKRAYDSRLVRRVWKKLLKGLKFKGL